MPGRRGRRRRGRIARTDAAPGGGGTLPMLGSGPQPVDDPVTGLLAEVHFLQPHQAHKPYRCPGCNQLIREGTGHVVVVPLEAADLRRHWHRPCWEARARRRPGRLRRPEGP